MNKVNKTGRKAFALTLVAAALMGMGQAQAKEVTDADIVNDAKTAGDVLSFGLGTQGQRFSNLAAVNTKTVKIWSLSGPSPSVVKSNAARNPSPSSSTARCT